MAVKNKLLLAQTGPKMKKVILAGILGALVSASASADTLYFAYKGFYDAYHGVLKPNESLTGHFVANDLNNDGAYSKNELVSLKIGRLNLENVCESYSDGYFISYCVKAFSYSASEGLTIDAYRNVSVEYNAHYNSVKTGEFYKYTWHGYDSGHITSWTWTPETKFVTSTSPVPEPASIAMLGLGLGTLMLARRRRR
ncbi:PEP-CTERM sorting domain-containing protein [Pseudoduganella albidiflava]|uniref:PEP-CTERM sorting domain-containing protein n=1 Tax=Pseudoduganella albidiflava TaxID=321983 RepID=A0A411WVW9_9BURK|nr:PEP-CTERM sorting domain-containing protein [Pseudoduganella albidiflava]QBI00894.1 PEP-CTERM sorting domain-containing protein [Pseudoduganella albidiflava]GGY60462.1 hypothetical protein GCM10007387_48760 [Pseudoduganella albidiflava]